MDHRAGKFPPVNSGGLIEAIDTTSTATVYLLTFPPVNSGGVIEAIRTSPSQNTPLSVFPPVNSGGLIEAVETSRQVPFHFVEVSAGEFRRPH